MLYINDLPDSVIIKGSVAIDTETMGLNHFRDRLCVVQMCDAHDNCYVVQIHDYNKSPNLKSLLSDNSLLKIFHFARFDVGILQKTFGVKIKNIYCTKIASKLARTYSDKHGLKVLCKELLGVDISKQEQSSDWGGELSNSQIEYAATDVLYLHKIMNKLNAILKRENRLELAHKCFESLHIFNELEQHHFIPEIIFQH